MSSFVAGDYIALWPVANLCHWVERESTMSVSRRGQLAGERAVVFINPDIEQEQGLLTTNSRMFY